MPDGFVSLAATLRERLPPNAGESGQQTLSPPAPIPVQPRAARDRMEMAQDLLQELGLMRLAVADAFERNASAVLQALAHDVLARELAIEPADIAVLVKRALGAFDEQSPVTLVVSACDADRAGEISSLPTCVDSSLGSGDLIVRVRDGSFESFVSFRLQSVLARMTSGDAT